MILRCVTAKFLLSCPFKESPLCLVQTQKCGINIAYSVKQTTNCCVEYNVKVTHSFALVLLFRHEIDFYCVHTLVQCFTKKCPLEMFRKVLHREGFHWICILTFQRAAAQLQSIECVDTASVIMSKSIPTDPKAVCNCCFVGTNCRPIKRDH